MGKLVVVVGGQWGSEGKGAIAAHLAAREPHAVFAVRTGGPNAGHTVVDEKGKTWKLRQLPTAAVSDPISMLGISAGSEIDPQVLEQELFMLGVDGFQARERLMVDREATLIGEEHRAAEEELVGRIGSTGKGIGAARADRVMRQARRVADYGYGWRESDVSREVRQWLSEGGTVLIEASQGYGLGLHAGWYPHCTSRDVRAIDAMAEVGVCPWWPQVERIEIWVVLRTFPIRVAGPSGPMHRERSWADLGLAPEHTTVTQKVRRVGEWDGRLAQEAIIANGGKSCKIALTMVDYVVPGVKGMTSLAQVPKETRRLFKETLAKYEHDMCGAKVVLAGTGPNTLIDMKEL